jgi:hypothetical protein
MGTTMASARVTQVAMSATGEMSSTNPLYIGGSYAAAADTLAPGSTRSTSTASNAATVPVAMPAMPKRRPTKSKMSSSGSSDEDETSSSDDDTKPVLPPPPAPKPDGKPHCDPAVEDKAMATLLRHRGHRGYESTQLLGNKVILLWLAAMLLIWILDSVALWLWPAWEWWCALVWYLVPILPMFLLITRLIAGTVNIEHKVVCYYKKRDYDTWLVDLKPSKRRQRWHPLDYRKEEVDLRTDVGKNSSLEHHNQRLTRYKYTRRFVYGRGHDGLRKPSGLRARCVKVWTSAFEAFVCSWAPEDWGLEVCHQKGSFSAEMLAQITNPHNMSVKETFDVACSRFDQTARTKNTMPLNKFDPQSNEHVVAHTVRIAAVVWMDQQRRTCRIPFHGAPCYH